MSERTIESAFDADQAVASYGYRTWLSPGTMLAVRELFLLGPAKSQREVERNMIRAIDAVAKRLGNTRAVCRKYYMHPGLVRGVSPGIDRAACLRRYTETGPPPASYRGAAARRSRGAAVLQEDAGET
jgi:DNA topoisomerase IB